MMNISLWAHIVSLIAFLGAGFWCLRLHRQRQILAEMLGYPLKVKVDWPLRFLRHLAESLSIESRITGSLRFGEPVKIDLASVSEFFRHNRVASISAEVMNGIINVNIVVMQTTKLQEAQLLQAAFQNSIIVTAEQKR